MMRSKATRAAATLIASTLAVSLAGCSATEVVSNVLDSDFLKSNPLAKLVGSPTVEEGFAQMRADVSSSVPAGSLIADGVLTVGVQTSSSAPMLVSSMDGTYTGYDADMAYAIADQLGLAVSFVPISNAATATAEGACDIAMDTRVADAGNVTIAGSYAETATAFFHKGSATTVSKADLAGKSVGVQGGSASKQLLGRSDLAVNQQDFENLNSAFEALEDGSVDYVLCDACSGAYLQGLYDDISIAGTIDAPASVGIAVSSQNAELAQVVKGAVDAISSNGVTDVLRGKWLGGMDALTPQSQILGVSISSATTNANAADADAESTELGGGEDTLDGSSAGANAVNIIG